MGLHHRAYPTNLNRLESNLKEDLKFSANAVLPSTLLTVASNVARLPNGRCLSARSTLFFHELIDRVPRS